MEKNSKNNYKIKNIDKDNKNRTIEQENSSILDFKTKIVLYFPNIFRYEGIILHSHQPSASLGYLAGMLEKHKIPYEILDAAAEKMDHKDITDKIKEYAPEFVGITTNIATMYASLVEAYLIRKSFPKIKIIMGGPWATAEYEYILKKNFADIVVIGEGEYTLLELMQAKKLSTDELKKIKGIAYREKKTDSVILTESRPLITDLDSLPYPRWEKFPLMKYNLLHRSKPYVPILTSRGCPYHCLNCTKIVHGYKVRTRSVENIMAELDYLEKQLHVKELVVIDDIFNMYLKRAKKILWEMIKKGYNFKIQLMNGIRADRVDEQFAKLFSAAGGYKAGFGIESGSQKVVNFLKKGLNLKVLPNAVKTLRKYNIMVYGYFMFGVPIENRNTLIQSVYFADKIDLDMAYFFTVIAFPGTGLYDYIKKQKHKLPDYAKVRSVTYHTTAIAFEKSDLTHSDIEKAHLYSKIRFYFNPKRLFRFIHSLSITESIYFLKKFIHLSARMFTEKLHLLGP